MKKLFLLCSIFLATQVVFNPARSQEVYQDNQQDISYQTFYDDLSPYGQWINYPSYGYVWSPNVEYGFKPYATNGHWVYSDMGWTWVSGYEWGWAAFHYGRWFYDEQYGWLWLPGTEWAPAWVSWRTSNDYYGWAPLSPNISIGISIGSYNPPYNYWCFVPHQYICDPYANRYYVHENRNLAIINNTTIINNTYYSNRGDNRYGNSYNRTFFASGPNRVEVERYTRNTIRPVAIRDNNRAGGVQISNNELSIFRPNVIAASRAATQQRFAPARIEPFRGSARAAENNNAGFGQNRVTNNDARFNNDRQNNFQERRIEPSNNLNQNNNAPSIQRNDNRTLFFNRRTEPVNNPPANIAADNRRNFFNNNNRDMQPVRQERQIESRPAFNNNSNRTTMQPQVFRSNERNFSGGGGFQQDRAPRVMSQPSQNSNRAFSQPAPNRSGDNGRDFGRRGR
jgi:hypothetical protein